MKGLRRSFAGGEIAPEMFGRIDLGKFQTGLQLARNFEILAHGPASRRPGFLFVNETRFSLSASRLIPFVFSADQAVVLELGLAYGRIHSSAGTQLESVKLVTGQTPPDTLTVPAHGYFLGDHVYYGGAYYAVGIVLDPNTIVLRHLDGAIPALPSFLNIARVYTFPTPWLSTHLSTLSYAQNADVLTVTSDLYPTHEIRRLGAANWNVTAVSFTPTLVPPTAPTATPTIPTPTNPTTQSYRITSIAADGITESAVSTTATASNNLTIAGNFNTVSWTAAAGAARYYVYKLRGGVFGYIGQTTGLSIVDDNILPDSTVSPPELTITLNAGTLSYPRAVMYAEQRRWFAGTLLSPQNVWATRNGTESNLTSSTPSRDDDALTFRVVSQQQNAIRFLVPLVDIAALTAGGFVRIFADGAAAITPGTVATKQQGFSGAGCAPVQPALAAASCLYVQAQGAHIRELTYDATGLGGYKSADTSLFAPHLFDGYQVKELAYSAAPDQIVWAVRTDGTLLGMTYVPEQQVYGWHHHDTNGTFESCAVIPENGEDVLYVVVRRVVASRTVRYVERRKSRLFGAQANAFYVDCGLTYTGAPATTLSNLRHLEGAEVQVLADGAVVEGRTVANGVLTPALDTAASKITVGLQYTSDMQTLPAVYDQAQAAGQGTMKNASKVHLRVDRSSLLQAGPSFDKLVEYPARAVSDPYGAPPALRSGEFALDIAPSWNTDGAVCIREDQPVPLTVLALTIDEAIGG